VGKLLTWTIWEYCEGKLINDHDKFAILELNYEKLKTFMEKLEDKPNIPRIKALCLGNNVRR
jgi:hypothetical protein